MAGKKDTEYGRFLDFGKRLVLIPTVREQYNVSDEPIIQEKFEKMKRKRKRTRLRWKKEPVLCDDHGKKLEFGNKLDFGNGLDFGI